MTPKYCRKDQRSCDEWGGGQGASFFIASVVQWKEKKALDVGGPSFDRFYLFLEVEKEVAGKGAQRPDWGGSEFKKTGARSARARTRGQNPLVIYRPPQY